MVDEKEKEIIGYYTPTTIHIKSSLPWPVSVSDGRDKPDGFSSVSMRQVQ